MQKRLAISKNTCYNDNANTIKSERLKGVKMISKMVNMTINDFLWDSKQVDFDLAIQRNYVWKEDVASLLIHSVLSGFSIGLIVAQNIDDVQHILDGKQRLMTLANYLNNKFALHINTSPVVTIFTNVLENTEETNEIIVAGLKFNELPEELQNRFTDYVITILQYQDISNTERDEIFKRLNNGVPLTTIEKTRAMAQGTVTMFLNDVANTDFFQKKVSISESGKNRYVHHEAILQILAVLLDKPTGVGSKDLQKLALELKREGIAQEVQDKVLNTAKYLANAYTDNASFLKKIHLSSIFKVAQQAINSSIDAPVFGEWTKSFFKETKAGTVYADACGSGSARYENVVKRLREMEKHYTENIGITAIVPDTEEKPKENKKTKKDKVIDIAKQDRKEDRELRKDLVRKGSKTVKQSSKQTE